MTDTSPPTQRSLLVPFQQPSSSQFQHAKNVDIHGGQFTTELGPRFTINVTRMFGSICYSPQIHSEALTQKTEANIRCQ